MNSHFRRTAYVTSSLAHAAAESHAMGRTARLTTSEAACRRTLLSSLTLMALAAVAASSAVSAEHRYEMTFYDARPGGAEIATEDYDAAIATARIRRWRDGNYRLVAMTNLCVAYVMKRAFEQAERSCGEAVSLASSADRSPWLRRGESATAKALNNRGVVRALRGDAQRASADFRRAALHASAWEVPARNSRTLDDRAASHRVAAQATHD
jgi:hypothetical protein